MKKDTETQKMYGTLLTIAEYADLNAVNKKTVYDWIKTNKLQPIDRGIYYIHSTTPAPKTYNKQKAA